MQWTPDQDETIRRCYLEERQSPDAIANEVGRSSQSVRIRIRELGLAIPIDWSLRVQPDEDIPNAPPKPPRGRIPMDAPVGSRWLVQANYVALVLAEDDPRRVGAHRSVKEHRFVMETVLGRRLGPEEHVHHKNGVHWDNRPGNLAVVSKAEHHRLENSLNGQWSRRYSQCVSCGRTDRPHHSRGYCGECYDRIVRGHSPKGQEKNRHYEWSLNYPRCVACGTTESPHAARGLCWRCREAARPERRHGLPFGDKTITQVIHEMGLLTTEEAAAILGVRPVTVKARVRRGTLRHQQFRGRLAFDLADLT